MAAGSSILDEVKDTDSAPDPLAGSVPAFEVGVYVIGIWGTRVPMTLSGAGIPESGLRLPSDAV